MSNQGVGVFARLVKHGCLDIWEHSGVMGRRLLSWVARKALIVPRVACWALAAMIAVSMMSKALDVWAWPVLSNWTGTKSMSFVWAKVDRCDGLAEYLQRAKELEIVHSMPKWDCRVEVDGSYIVAEEYSVNLSAGKAFEVWSGKKLEWTAAHPEGGARSVAELAGIMGLSQASRGVNSIAMQWGKWWADPSVGVSDVLVHVAFNFINVMSFVGMVMFVLIFGGLLLLLPAWGLGKSIKKGVNAWSDSGFEERALKRELEKEAKKASKSGPSHRL